MISVLRRQAFEHDAYQDTANEGSSNRPGKPTCRERSDSFMLRPEGNAEPLAEIIHIFTDRDIPFELSAEDYEFAEDEIKDMIDIMQCYPAWMKRRR